MRQVTTVLLAMMLASSALRAGSLVPSCDAPMFGEKRPSFRPGPAVVYDTLTLDAQTPITRADSQAVLEAGIDIGVRCAIDVVASLGGLRTYELLKSAHICTLQSSSGMAIPPQLQENVFDRVALCRIEFGREAATRKLVHVTLRVFVSGGVPYEDGSKVFREFEIRLTRYAGSRAWTVDSYASRLGS